MQLKDINNTIIDENKLTLINNKSIDTDALTLTITLNTDDYSYAYNNYDDLVSDYSLIKTTISTTGSSLKDINGTIINKSKLTLFNNKAINIDKKRLTLTLDSKNYTFKYNSEQKLINDYNAIKLQMELGVGGSIGGSGGTADLTPIINQLNDKVDKVSGKGLSKNDYTNIDKQAVQKVKDNIDDLIANSHTHDNKAALDKITDEKIKKWDAGTGSGESSVMDNTSLTMSTIGGIPAGSSLDGKSCIEILEAMFFPYVKPVISSVTLSKTPNANIYEKGTTVTINSVVANIQKKSKPITYIQFYVNGSKAKEITSSVANGGSFTYSPALSITDDIANTYIQVKVSDGDNIVTSNSQAVKFVYPFYYGTIVDGAVIDETLITSLTKDVSNKSAKTYSFNTSNSCMVIAYPASYGNIRTIIDPNGFDITGSFTKSQVAVTANDSTSQTYNVYVSSANTNSNFAVKFNI